MIDKLLNLRSGLERKRDRIDAQIELIDQLIALDEEDNGDGGAHESQPPPERKKKVVKRRRTKVEVEPQNQGPARAGRLPPVLPPVSPRGSPIARSLPIAKGPAADIVPTKCGGGTVEVRDGSNMDKVVSAIRGRAPHWISHEGIAEAADAMGLNTPKTFRAIIHQVCAQLRKGTHNVPGLEYKTIGRRVEYRMPVIKRSKETD